MNNQIDKTDTLNALQFTNIVNARFKDSEIRNIFPVLYSSDDNICVLADIEHSNNIDINKLLEVTFENKNFKYCLTCKIVNIDYSKPSLLYLEIKDFKKYTNSRASRRFDTCLAASINFDNKNIKSKILDIGMGGVKVAVSENIDKINTGSPVSITIEFEKQSKISFEGIVAWEAKNHNLYGIKFEKLSIEKSKSLQDEINKIEKNYLRALNKYRDYNKKEAIVSSNARILIFNLNTHDSYDIKEALVKLGAENFDLLQSLKTYYDFINTEKPDIIIIDACKIAEEDERLIKRIRDTFTSIEMLLVLGFEYLDQYNEILEKFGDIDIIYRPFIFNEFESKILNAL